MTDVQDLSGFEVDVGGWIHLLGVCIEIFGVLVVTAGILWSTYACIFTSVETKRYDQYRIRIGRSLLLGLEILVAADIIKTIATEITFASLGLLAGLVAIRTFLSWTLTLEIEGRWPWSKDSK